MKLYTESQVREAYLEGWNDGQHDNIGYIDRVVSSLTPIELPSDEEINEKSEATYRGYPNNPKDHPEWTYNQDINAPRKRKAFIEGAKCVIEQIKKQII